MQRHTPLVLNTVDCINRHQLRYPSSTNKACVHRVSGNGHLAALLRGNRNDVDAVPVTGPLDVIADVFRTRYNEHVLDDGLGNRDINTGTTLKRVRVRNQHISRRGI